jgi:hypothetical protein
MDGFNNFRVIKLKDVPLDLVKEINSLVHHWLHHQ